MTDAKGTGALSATATPSFQTRVTVRFGDCDPAGIVFYPRILEMFNNLVEDWFSAGLDFSFDDIVVKRGWGLPTVHLEVDFLAPCFLGEVLTAKLFVRSVGTSSIRADIVLTGPTGIERIRGKVVLVLIVRYSQQAMALPDALRNKIAGFIVPG